jgi:uridine kinase
MIGGFSRAGKTTLAQYISKALSLVDICNLSISLDSWIVSLEKRSLDSKVMERYECDVICKSITALLEGNPIFTPVYDHQTRRRISERSAKPLLIDSGFVIVDGVVSLALDELRKQAVVNIFVDLPKKERAERVRSYYIKEKKFSECEANMIVAEREFEEVPFIENTKKYADIIYLPNYLSEN